jgi:NAD(P)-dependent dehydrogenase (short-subunit alcohol dehydrogenase family)
MPENNIFSLSKKLALITGASGKVGFRAAAAIVDAGANAIITCRTLGTAKEICNKLKLINQSAKLYPMELDIADPKNIQNFKESLQESKFSIDFFLHAAIFRPEFKKDSTNSWDSIIRINSFAFYNLTKFICENMSDRGGSIAHISSIYSHRSPDFTIYDNTSMGTEATYPFLKAGEEALSRYFSSIYASKNIRINSIVLGGVFDNQDKEFIKKYIEKVPLKRMAKLEDIDGTVIFLASDASSYVTGSSIILDGGLISRI